MSSLQCSTSRSRILKRRNRDLGAAVDYILNARGITKLDLMGWSWGTSIAGNYVKSA